MLKNIPPILGPDLLGILRAMGHGDEIAIVDANYPVEPHQSRAGRIGGIVSIDNGDFVAMAHGAQDAEQVGAEDRRNILEHGWS